MFCSSFRSGLRRGRGRVFASIVSFLGIVVLFCCMDGLSLWSYSTDDILANALQNALTGMATIAGMLSIIAYNLRCRMMDYSVKIICDADNYIDLSIEVERSGSRLTNIAFGGFITLLFIVAAKAIPFGCMFALGVGFTVVCCIQYMYVVFAFEGMESDFIKCIKEKREKEERIKKQKIVSDRNAKYPDNL